MENLDHTNSDKTYSLFQLTGRAVSLQSLMRDRIESDRIFIQFLATHYNQLSYSPYKEFCVLLLRILVNYKQNASYVLSFKVVMHLSYFVLRF